MCIQFEVSNLYITILHLYLISQDIFLRIARLFFLKLWDINLVARVMSGSFLTSKSRELQVSDIIACRCDFQMWVYGIIFICFICNISTVVHL